VTVQPQNLDLAELFRNAVTPAGTQADPPPPETFPTVPNGVWRIITDRQGAAATGDNGRLLSATTTATMAHNVRPGMVVITSTDPNFAQTGGSWSYDALLLTHVQALVILSNPTVEDQTYTVEWATGISPNQQPNSEHMNLVDRHGVPIPFTLPVARMLLVIPMEDEANQLAALIRCRMRQWMTDYPRARAVMERILGSFPSPPGVGRVRDRNRSRRQEVEEPEPR
jgi:hypothetical protein